MADKYSVLQQFFGYREFRGGQETLIDGILGGKDVFGIMPTGGGKSLCYQVPALLLPGITLVVSPLISLMQDQVIALKNAGIPAAYLNTSLTPEQIRLVYRNIRLGMYKIIYVAPERLGVESFLALSQDLHISQVAVDEAHCISQWGQDFRPSYMKIVDYLQALPRRPIVSVFTATATPRVQKDIRESLKLQDPVTVVTGFDRANLRYEVRTPEDKQSALIALVAARKNKAGIVYCTTRKDVEAVCTLLTQHSFAATRYHAGLPDTERQKNQEDFLFDRKTVMVATNAFGMGIDKSNVSYVIHYNMPKSPEAYYQEAGRAGRDGDKAECILLYSKRDIYTARFLIQKSGENPDLTPQQREQVMAQDLHRLTRMIDYCETSQCLRQFMLSYFGESHPGNCGNCSCCSQAKRAAKPARPAVTSKPGKVITKELTQEAQMILSCIQRVKTHLGHTTSQTMLTFTLRGSKQKKVIELGLDELSSFAIMAEYSRDEINELFHYFADCKLLSIDKTGLVDILPLAGDVLFRDTPVEIRLEENAMEARFPRSGTDLRDSKLLAALKRFRTHLAEEEQIPAHSIFTNTLLTQISQVKPETLPQLLKLPGMTQAKAEKYGARILTIVSGYR